MASHGITKLSPDECYPNKFHEQFDKLKVKQDLDAVYNLIRDIVRKFHFYPEFYDLFQNGNVLSELDHLCNILFGCELA